MYAPTQLFLHPSLIRLLAVLLCLCLLPIAESDSPARSPLLPAHEHTLAQDALDQNFPAMLAEAPGIFRLSGQRSTSQRTNVSSGGELWILLCAVPVLPSARISPVAWNLASSRLHLPAARGLINFALPPPQA